MTARAARSTIASLTLWARHVLPLSPDTIADRLDAGETSALRDFLRSIDGATATFPSDTDGFLDRLTP